jgi:hypothetical protein
MKSSRLLKWGLVVPTREYIGGILGGLGLGVFITMLILSPAHRVTESWVWLVVCGCIVTGSFLARAAQRKRFQNDSVDGNHKA